MSRTEPRQITPEVLDDIEEWVRTSIMFHSSPEGRAFGQELKEIIELARDSLLRKISDREIRFIDQRTQDYHEWRNRE